ncbi:hypothetical protein F8388_003601 [Cannabis sativa]|uniref:Uncharacterized protein n=1 Tax=Cannabis sativa TaxID=3483 RepID=A0A7J6EME2_CANSA|nr:hypothetical protein F8388_003601 [Cannabis sativa]
MLHSGAGVHLPLDETNTSRRAPTFDQAICGLRGML